MSVKKIFSKILNNVWAIPYLPWTAYFNFHYLPFRQAIKFPILLSKPTLINLKGSVEIKGDVSLGMIKLGQHSVGIYRSHGITIENHGGRIIFNGTCHLDSGTNISVGEGACLTFGNDVRATAELKLVCYHSVTICDHVLIGWENMILDTNFHQLTSPAGESVGKSYAPVKIGAHTWSGFRNVFMPGTDVPEKCVIAANSLLNKKYDIPPYSLLAGAPAEIKATGVWRNHENDTVVY